MANQKTPQANQISTAKTLTITLLFILTATLSMAQGTWTKVNALAPDYNGGVMLLLTDGTVITKTYFGGIAGTTGNTWNKLTPDSTGSYANGTWSRIAPMINDRLYFSSWILNDGRVYVGGGEYGSGTEAEVYNPVTNTWTGLTAPGPNFLDGASQNLPDGRLLLGVATGTTLTNYFFDPASNSFSAAASNIGSHDEAAWLKLPDNSILQVDMYSYASERYIPASNTWVADGTVPVALYDPYGYEAGGAVLLPDGRAFFIGSTGHTAFYTPSGNTSPGSWAAGPDLPTGKGAPDAPAAMLNNGKVLLALSPLPTSGNHFPTPTTFYEFDYTNNTYTQVGAPAGGTSAGIAPYLCNMLSLPDGTVLYTNEGNMQYYIYTPSGTPLTAGKPGVDNILRSSCDTFTVTGTLFTGIAEGAVYGDDWTMNTNYPIIKISSGSKSWYARSFNWNRYGTVCTGTAADTAKFILPSGLTPGTYALQVIVNGNASAAKTFNTQVTISPSSITLCQGASTSPAVALAGGIWSSSNTAIVAASGPASVSGISAGTATITYAFGTCKATATVTVSPASTSMSGTTTVCAGTSAVLSASGSSTYSWSPSYALSASTGASVTATPSVTTTYTVTGINSSGCSSTATGTITVNPLPAVSAGTSTAICAGGNATLTASGATTYSWTPATGLSASTGVTTVATPGATTTYTITGTDAQGCTASGTKTVVVNANPVVSAGTGISICNGVAGTLTATGASTYSWAPSTGLNTTIGATVSASPVTTTIYTVTGTSAAGCTASAATTVTVNALALSSSGNITICPGGSASIYAYGASTYSWTPATSLSVTTGATVIATPAVSTTYTVTGYDATTGCTASTTLNVDINAITISASGSAAICTGAATPLSVSGADTYVWSPSTGLSATTGASVSASPSATTTYTVTGTNLSTGCSDVTTITVTVNAVPVVTAGSSATICAGDAALLSASGATSYVWTCATGSIAPGTTTMYPSATTTYTVTGTDTNGCSATATTTYTVHALPAVDAGASLSICAGASAAITASGAATYTWTPGTGLSITTGYAITASPGTTTTYTITGTDGYGCSNTASITVTVNALPVVGVATGSAICAGTSATITATGAASYSWAPATSLSSSTGATVTATPATSTTYTVIGTGINGCSSNTTITITVNAIPAISAGSAIAICNGSSNSINATGGATYTWSPASGLSATTGSTTIASPSASTTYTVIGTSTDGCTNSATVNVDVNPLPAITATGNGGVICAGSDLNLASSATGGTGTINYSWTGPNSFSATTQNPTIAAATTLAEGTYTVTATDVNGCIAPGTHTTVTTVNPTPSAGSITGDGLCKGGTTTLTETEAGGTWSIVSSIASIGSSTGIVTSSGIGGGIVSYTVTNMFGCSSVATKFIIAQGAHGNIYTLTGTGTNSCTGDGGSAYLASIQGPRDMTTDAAGNLYFCDVTSNRIRKISITGMITTIAGTGTGGNSGDGGPATAATLNGANGIYVDNAGNVFISNTNSHTIRKIDATTGIINTIAGVPGSAGFTGDGCAASTAKLSSPLGLCGDAAGNIYIVDQNNFRIRKIDAATGIITTIVGSGSNYFSGDGGPGTAARISYARGITIDNNGNLYILDAGNSIVRKYVMATGIITTIAGTPGSTGSTGDWGAATNAKFYLPARIAFDGGNNIYVVDQGNNKIRRINLGNGIITTAVGTGGTGFSGDGGPATAATIWGPCGLACDKYGNLYIADANNRRIRVAAAMGSIQIALNGPSTVTKGTPVTFTATPSVTLNATYQWQKNGVNVGTGGTTYTNISPDDGDVYRCIQTITPVCGSAYDDTSNSITINLYGIPEAQPAAVAENNQFTAIRLFPNPARETSTIAASGVADGTATITIIDQMGKVASMKTANVVNNTINEALDMQSLAAGLYIVNLTDASGKSVRLKCIKN